MTDISGKTLGTWEGMMPFGLSDNKIKAKEEVGKGFSTKEDALKAARNNPGSEAVVKEEDGKFHLYSIDDNSNAKFTRDSIAQVKGYSVSNVTTKGAEVKNVISFVTKDDYEVLSPSEHQNRFSGENYDFSGKNKVSSFIGKSDKEMQDAFNANTTQGVNRTNRPKSVKDSLEPSLKIIELYDSKAADWLRNLKESKYVLAGDSLNAMGQKIEIYAAWTPAARDGASLYVNNMILGNNFWNLNDADKATALYHEYTHAVDPAIGRTIDNVSGTIDNLVNNTIGNKSEDRAYTAQWKMMQSLGIKSGMMNTEVSSYLKDRNIDPSTIK